MVDIIKLTNEFNYIKSKSDKSELICIQNRCKEHISSINKKLSSYIDFFNTIVNDIVSTLKNTFLNDIMLVTYHDVLGEIIKNNKVEPISAFLIYVYSNDTFRQYIIEGNENFFLGCNYEGLATDQNKVMTIFQFKAYWGKLSNDHREFIKNAMKTLISICEKYIVEKSNGNKIAKILCEIDCIL